MAEEKKNVNQNELDENELENVAGGQKMICGRYSDGEIAPADKQHVPLCCGYNGGGINPNYVKKTDECNAYNASANPGTLKF